MDKCIQTEQMENIMPASLSNLLINVDPMLVFILAVMLGVLGLILSVVYRSKIKADRESKNWPSAPGKITFSRVEERAGHRRVGQGSRSATYIPLIKYSYTVNGTPYQGDHIGNGIYQTFSRLGPSRWVKRYPIHADVKVYYNPADPANALLEPTSSSNIVGLVLALGVDLLGVFFLGLWIYRLFKG
jgi:hypothetical protein